MASTIRIKKRAATGSAGAPSSLASSELAFNESDLKLYYGFGDGGSADASSIIAIGGSGAFCDLTTAQTVAGNKTFSGNLAVTGDLTVNGTTTTVNSTTTTVDDPVFTVGGDSAPGSDDNKDRGIEFRWHNGSAAKIGFFGFDDSTGKFTFIPDATNSSEVFSGSTGTISADIDGNANTATSLANGRTISMTGDVAWTSASFDGSGNVTGAGTIQSGAVETSMIAADAVTGAKIADDAIDSEHLAADSIDAEHYAAGSVDTTALGADAVTGAKIADDTIDSEHYAAASIDNEHLADDAVGVAELSATGTASSSTFLRGDNSWATPTASTPTDITVADESSDTTCFPLFVTAATGDLGPKSGSNLTFNSSSGDLVATSFSGLVDGGTF